MGKKYFWLKLFILILGVAALLSEHLFESVAVIIYITAFVLMLLVFLLQLAATEFKMYVLKKSLIPGIIFFLYLILFFIRIFSTVRVQGAIGEVLPILIILQQIIIIFGFGQRIKKIDVFLQELFLRPARTILVSFFLVILIGTMLLQLPVATINGTGLHFIDAFFTSTSAVCVTGLIVVDTATVFTLFGHLVILGLIQVGGLSIIILSFFVVFVLRKRISLESKILISYVLSADDVSSISGSIKRIIVITLLCEITGMLLLFFRFLADFSHAGKAILFAVFHAVSAFCNAGFALFTNSLENYAASPYISLVISMLIITGGISFAVFVNLFENFQDRIKYRRNDKHHFIRKLSLNTKIVLGISAVLLITGMFIIYALEHGKALRDYSTGTQYLAAFFQSVTLRTAGFNTIPFGTLSTATLLVMIVYMFIGGASGSTAGGIKVNTLAVILAWIKSAMKREEHVILFKNMIKKEIIMRGLLIVLFGFATVLLGTFILAITETAPFQHILFEAVSAFGTVGLSAGITGSLTAVGKIVIIVMMFIGRTGPLTILAAMNEREQKVKIGYPYGDILIG